MRKVRGRVIPVRNRVHSLPGVIALGALFGAYVGVTVSWKVAYAPLLALLLHYVEDLVTEGGVYLFGKRVRLGGISYDNLIANRLTVAAFFAAALAATDPLPSPFENPLTFSLYLLVLLYNVSALLA